MPAKNSKHRVPKLRGHVGNVPHPASNIRSALLKTRTQPIELKITQSAWEAAARRLLLDEQAFAVGTIRWNCNAHISQALVSRWEIVAEPPHGTDHAPLEDVLMLWLDRDGALASGFDHRQNRPLARSG